MPLQLYEEMLEDLQRIAAEIEHERGGGHNSKNAALVRLIEKGIADYRAHSPKTQIEPPEVKQAAKGRKR